MGETLKGPLGFRLYKGSIGQGLFVGVSPLAPMT